LSAHYTPKITLERKKAFNYNFIDKKQKNTNIDTVPQYTKHDKGSTTLDRKRIYAKLQLLP